MKMLCPFSQKKCKEKKCPLWVLMYETSPEGKVKEVYRCGFAWLPIMISELKNVLQNSSFKKV